MSEVPFSRISHSMVRMRSSLARVELAASRIARDSSTPATRELAAGISESVHEIDDEIDGNLRALRPEPQIDTVSESCGQILETLHDRMSPVLRAHEIDGQIANGGERACVGDPITFERAALTLLSAGISMAGRAGRLRLEFVRGADSERIGLRLATRSASTTSIDAQEAMDAVASLRSFAQRSNTTLEVSNAEDATSLATLWLPTREGSR